MIVKRIFIIFGFLFALLWGVSKLKEAATRMQFEVFNEPVVVRVVGLPLCGRSNIIEVEYQEEKYNISINKNDCIQGKYNLGSTLQATYNTRLNEMNPGNFLGVYRLYMIFLIIVGMVFIFYLFVSIKNYRLKK